MNLLNSFINFILPAYCPVCHKKLTSDNALCGQCFAELHFVGYPTCQICGRELPKTMGKICGHCLKEKFYFRKNISVLKYDQAAKKIILPFKHGDHIELAQLICKWMILKGKEVILNSDVIIPVPLHKRRLLKRKYNQSAILAKIIAHQFQKEYQPLILLRSKNTPSQGHLDFKKRKKNVKGSFMIKNSGKIENKKILLIDDVFTSGATLNECAKVLLSAGAKQVDCLTFCRAGDK